MDQFVYRDILEEKIVPHADNDMSLLLTFQQDNEPKRTSKLVKHSLDEFINFFLCGFFPRGFNNSI